MARLAEQYAAVEKVLEAREKRANKRALRELFSSGRPVDMGLVSEAISIDPTLGASLLKSVQGQETEKRRQENLRSQMSFRSLGALASGANALMEQWDNLPAEQQTAETWRRGYLQSRQQGIALGIDPQMLPEDANPDYVRGLIGYGFSVAGQEQAEHREAQAEAQERRHLEGQALSRELSGARIAAANTRALMRLNAPPKPERPDQFERDMLRAGIEPGSEEYRRLAKGRYEKSPGLEQFLLGPPGEGLEEATPYPPPPGPAARPGRLDLRLESTLSPQTAEVLRSALVNVPPPKQRQVHGILRRLAAGRLDLGGAADELEVLGL